jgi:oligopeptidase A
MTAQLGRLPVLDSALPNAQREHTAMSGSDQSQASTSNPLEGTRGIPAFAAIRAEHVEPAVDALLAEQRAGIERITQSAPQDLSWLEELERMHEMLHRTWGPVVHLNSVASNPSLRDAYNRCVPRIAEFSTEVSQNRALYERFAAVRDRAAAGTALRQLVEHALRDFRLSGVALDASGRSRFRELMQELAQKQAQFEQNLMDATDAFEYRVTDAQELAGLPDVVRHRAQRAAADKSMDGWLLVLDPPTYMAVLSHAESASLRKRFYDAWVTRASDQGPHAGRWDNGGLIEEIVALRHAAARLVGFDNYAEYSLETKMAATPAQVLEFLRDLAARSRAQARQELSELSAHAGRALEPWDIPYFAERLKQDRFQISEEALREYFPLPKVMAGLFDLLKQLFDLDIRESPHDAVWHRDVTHYSIRRRGEEIGELFVDPYARPNKRGGAWMDSCLSRARLPGLTQQPVAHLVCNFNPPVGDQASLLTHSDVVTLFHEFGHALHHLLTEVDYPSLAGINGVAWDAVELPSQFLENFAWMPNVLRMISQHVRSGATLPEDKIATINRARTFQAGLALARQLEFALFDLRLHTEFSPAAGARVHEILREVRDEVAVIKPPAYNRFPNSFGHVFGGGYAAGYYSYKWAEVLAADAFAAFATGSALDTAMAERFRRCILAIGGTQEAMDAFVAFRGREPELEHLLKQSGILQAA